MSLLKWTLVTAGAAVGMRYLSERHRRRMADGGNRAPQTDRDDGRDADAPWSVAQYESGDVGAPAVGPGQSTGMPSGTPGSDAGSVGHDDLLSPGSQPLHGGPSSRY